MDKTRSKEVIMLAPGGGPTLTMMGAKIAFKVSSAETGGAWALLEHSMPPHFEGTAMHWHKITRSGFYVLEGKVTFKIGTQTLLVETGGFASVPHHTVHTFSNEQDQPARLLEILLPGGSENYFKELVALTQTEQQTIRDLYKRYDMFMPDES